MSNEITFTPAIMAGFPLSDFSADAYRFSEQIGHLLRRAYQRHMAIFQAAIPDSNLTAAQFVTLCAVKEQQSCSFTDIVKATAIDQATIRGVIERLQARSLVVVHVDVLDGRKRIVRTTAEGLALIDQSIPFAKQVSEQTLVDFNPAERFAIFYLLNAMIREEKN